MRRLLPALALLLCGVSAQAQQLVRDGAYVVHYAALGTSDLNPDMARQYGILQRGDRALLLLNLQRETAPGKTQPLQGSASGSARDLLGNVQTLKFRPAGDGSTQDLIAEFSITHLEFLRFDVEVRPEGAARPLAVQFQQQFFNADR